MIDHRQTDRQTDRHAHHNTQLPYLGRSNKLCHVLSYQANSLAAWCWLHPVLIVLLGPDLQNILRFIVRL